MKKIRLALFMIIKAQLCGHDAAAKLFKESDK